MSSVAQQKLTNTVVGTIIGAVFIIISASALYSSKIPKSLQASNNVATANVISVVNVSGNGRINSPDTYEIKYSFVVNGVPYTQNNSLDNDVSYQVYKNPPRTVPVKYLASDPTQNYTTLVATGKSNDIAIAVIFSFGGLLFWYLSWSNFKKWRKYKT